MVDHHADLNGILTEHIDASNCHDLDRFTALLAEDCVFDAAGGIQVYGQRFRGKTAVNESFAALFDQVPDAQWANARHYVLGDDYGLSEWTFTGTLVDGTWLEVAGCCFVTVKNGLITRRNAYRKEQRAGGGVL